MHQVSRYTARFETSKHTHNLEIGKAANAGGVAVSGLEMAQNSQRISWTREEVDGKLKDIMKAAFENGLKNAKEYVPVKDGEFPSLVAGSNIAGFVKVVVSRPHLSKSDSVYSHLGNRRRCTTKVTGGKLGQSRRNQEDVLLCWMYI
jgi:hypothetical protein